ALPLVTSQLPFFVKPTLLSTHGVSSLYRCISVRQVLVVVWEAQVNAAVQCRVQPASGHGLFLGEEIKALGAICLRVTKQRVLKSAEGVVRHWLWLGNVAADHGDFGCVLDATLCSPILCAARGAVGAYA